MIDISVTTAQPVHACRIDVTSANGTHFQTDVDVTYGSGYCPPVLRVDASQSTIEVTFPDGGVDAGPSDSAVPSDAIAERLWARAERPQPASGGHRQIQGEED